MIEGTEEWAGLDRKRKNGRTKGGTRTGEEGKIYEEVKRMMRM